MKTSYFAYLLSATMLASLPLAPATAQADNAAQQSRSFSIPAGRLSQGVLTLSEQAGVQIVFDSDTTASAQGNAVSGTMPLGQALDRLVSGTGLRWRWLKSGVVTIESAGTADGEVVTGAVNVEGVQGSAYFGGAGQAAGVNGTNGSRDITATEGTGSFTSGALTIGSKVPQALKDVPQSISVLTSERLEQQNVTDFTTAMKQLPGITLEQGTSSLETNFYSRGFAINSIQVDGGAPLAMGTGYYPQIDMSQYDHVELLRGADGTFNGYGDPSGTVNLVRKKPLDHAQVTVEAQAGSWSNYRLVADATSPLALDGRLRGRLVMTYQNNHYFYDTAKDNKTLLYGIAEFDATPSTLITAGISYTRQDSLPWRGGLPRYQTGTDLKLPRSTSFALPWSRWNFDTTELFGSIEQKLGDQWTAKLNLTDNRQSSTQKLGYSQGAVNPDTGAGPVLTGTYRDYTSRQFSAEATVAGSFEILGQRQEITVGASRTSSNSPGSTNYSGLFAGTSTAPYQPYPGGPAYYSGSVNGSAPPIDVFDFDPSNPLYTEPRNPLPTTRYSELGDIQTLLYANLRLTAFDRLHLTLGLHWSRYEDKTAYDQLCVTAPTTGTPGPGSCVGRQIGDVYNSSSSIYRGDDISWPPTVSLSYDLTKSLTAYVGYADIYRSQASYLDVNLKAIDPITGSNIEGGLKWASRDGRLNLSLAAYRIKQAKFAVQDGTVDYDITPEDAAQGITYYAITEDGTRVPDTAFSAPYSCCFKSDPNVTYKSQGIDVEGTGEILPGWQASVNYTYSRTKQVGSWFGTNEGLPFTSIQPRNLYKLWTSFDFGAARFKGALSGLTLSVGINGQSSGYQSGYACTQLNPPNALGVSTCKAGYNLPYSFVVPAYAVVSGRIAYRLADKWSFALNLDNIFDKTYYQTTGSTTSGNWYGAPRSFTVTLGGKW